MDLKTLQTLSTASEAFHYGTHRCCVTLTPLLLLPPSLSLVPCYDEIKGTQDRKIYSHADSQILSLIPSPYLSPTLVLVVMIKSKELKTKISHTHSLILSRPHSCLESAGMANTAPRPCLFTLTQSHIHTHSLSLVLVVMIKSKELKTKISHTHSLILSRPHSLSLVLVVVMKAKELKTKISHTHSLILSLASSCLCRSLVFLPLSLAPVVLIRCSVLVGCQFMERHLYQIISNMTTAAWGPVVDGIELTANPLVSTLPSHLTILHQREAAELELRRV